MPNRCLTILLLTIWLLPARMALADAEAAFKQGILALEDGHPAAALALADEGYAEKKLGKLLLLKALALEKLGRFGDAWVVIQLVVPKDLPALMRDEFVKCYERLEIASKQQAADQQAQVARAELLAAQAHAEQKAAAERREKLQSRATALWIAGGAATLAGGGLWFYGWNSANAARELDLTQAAQHAAYRDQTSTATTLYWTGVGCTALGAAVLGWAALSQAQVGAVHVAAVQPWASEQGAGVLVSGGWQ